MPKIPLSKGYVATVDMDDYEMLSKYKWSVISDRRHQFVYAIRHKRNSAGKTIQAEILMHREIMNVPIGYVTDHINGDTLDNRKCNLRICTNQENVRFQQKTKQKRSSVYKGVTFNKSCKKWQSQIKVDNKQLYIGIFETETDAAKSYDTEAKKHFGSFAKLNFP